MKKFGLFFAGIILASSFGTAPVVHAHSVQQCKQELRIYRKICFISPTALIGGFCDIKKTLKWCADKKLHKEKFHK